MEVVKTKEKKQKHKKNKHKKFRSQERETEKRDTQEGAKEETKQEIKEKEPEVITEPIVTITEPPATLIKERSEDCEVPDEIPKKIVRESAKDKLKEIMNEPPRAKSKPRQRKKTTEDLLREVEEDIALAEVNYWVIW